MIAFSFIAENVFSDGMVIERKFQDWQLQAEERQLCAINFENGKQNMLLSIEVGEIQGDKAVWIFPVPSKPEETELDIMDGFPEFYGKTIEEEKNDSINSSFTLLFLTQSYLWPVFLLGSAFLGSVSFGGMASLDGEEGFNGVEVYKHIEKMGLTTELITAENSGSFYDYLLDKDLELPMSAEPVLKEYIGKDFSFVVVWVSDTNLFNEMLGSQIQDYYNEDFYYYDEPRIKFAHIGVFVSFPSDEIFFPLKPTSVYGEKEIPIIIYVTDFVSPELFSGVTGFTETEYFVEDYYGSTEGLENFFNGKDEIKKLNYTKISINAPSENFSQDLTIKKEIP